VEEVVVDAGVEVEDEVVVEEAVEVIDVVGVLA
jgi:hypothetical protein